MFLTSKKIVVVAVNDRELSITEFERTHAEPKLTASSTGQMPSGVVSRGKILDRNKFVGLVKEALKKAQPAEIKTKETIVVFPEQQVYLTLLSFSVSKSPAEILEEAPKEALSTIPLDYTQIFCDFYAVPGKDNKHSEVVYAACDKNVANTYLQLLFDVGLKPVMFTIEPDALAASEDIEPYQPVLFLVLGKQRSYWIFTQGNTVKKTSKSALRISETSLQDFETLRSEAQSILESLNGEKNNDSPHSYPPRIVITIECDPAKEIEEDVSQAALKLQKALNVNTKLLASKFPKEIRLVQIAFGAARRFFQKKTVGRGIDLLPVPFREQAALFQLNSFITSLSIMFIIAASGFISVYSYAWSEMYFEYERAFKESTAIAQNVTSPRFQEIKAETISFNEEVDELTQIQSQMFYYSKIWEDLSKASATPGITSRTAQFTGKDAAFELTGIAAKREDLQSFEQKLKNLSFVAEVISPLSNLDRMRDISYKLTIKLNPKMLPYLSTGG